MFGNDFMNMVRRLKSKIIYLVYPELAAIEARNDEFTNNNILAHFNFFRA